MADSFAQGLIQSLLQSTQAPQGPSSADMVSIMQSKNPMATYMAANVDRTAGQIGKGVRGMLSGIKGQEGSVLSPNEMIQQQLSKSSLSTSEDYLKLAQMARAAGKPAEAIQLNMAAQELKVKEDALLKENNLRESLATRANSYNMPTVAESLAGGGSIADATAMITEEEKRRMLAKGDRKSRQVFAQSVNAGPLVIMDIAKGKYDNLSSSDFKSFIEGDSAELKPFERSGEIVMLPVSEFGKVLNPETNTWDSAFNMGLKPSVVKTEVLNLMDKVGDGLWEGEVRNFTDRAVIAQDAVTNLKLINDSVSLIDSGMKTGAFANFRLGAAKALKQMGLISGESDQEQIANTEAFVARAGERVASIIKAFGAGTGLSDADRKYAERIAAGDITLDEQAIRKILALSAKYDRMALDDHNATVTAYKERGIGGENIDLFYKRAPLTQYEIGVATSQNSISEGTVATDTKGQQVYKVDGTWRYESGEVYK